MNKTSFARFTIIILSFLIVPGCVIIGKNTIHTPSASEGVPIKFHHPHGGATKNSPPDAIVLTNFEDSVSIGISARVIKSKNCFAGVVIPIFPTFLFPPKKHYKNDPETLEIKMVIRTKSDLEINPDSLLVLFRDSIFTPEKAEVAMVQDFEKFDDLKIKANMDDFYEFQYPYIIRELPDHLKFSFQMDAMKADRFQLNMNCFTINSKKLNFPEIVFEKKKQLWVFMGP